MDKVNNNTEMKTKKIKTYSVKSLIILMFLFIITFMVLIFYRDYKADILVLEVKQLDKEIKELKKQADVLRAEEVKYSAPNRLTAIGFESGLNEITDREDIIYLKLEK